LQLYITVSLPCVRMEQEVCLHCVFFNVTGLDTVVHSSCLMTISRSLQFVAKSFPKLLRLINICINTWQIFAVAFLWTTVHYVWWWLRSSLVGWVGSISYWVGLGWITENGPTSTYASIEWPSSNPISRSRYYSTSNNSKVVQERFTMADQ